MNEKSLAGRTTLVTGASRGIGRAIVLEAARAGSDVALLARDPDRLAQVAQEARAFGVRVHVESVDLAEPGAAEKAFESSAAALGGVHHLVANAGMTIDTLLMRLKPADWDRVIATNLTAAFSLCRASVPGMIRARYGRIVFISSISGLMGNPGQAAYAASKAGLVGLARSLAREVGSRGVTVNVVSPGLVDTDMVKGMTEKARGEMLTHIPMGRLGTAEEIAGAVGYLLSPPAAYVTGAILNVSGGLYM